MSVTLDINFDQHIDYATFEHMAIVVTEKKLDNQIFLIDSDPQLLVDLVKKVASTDTDAVKIGVLYRACGHTTPFCIEKVLLDEEEEIVVVYNTDSMALDRELVDHAREEIQNTIRMLAKHVPVYSLAFENAELSQRWKRQFDQGSCATFALFDLEQILAMEMGQFYDFVQKCSSKLDDENPNIFVLGRLPVCLMAAIQSAMQKLPLQITQAGLFNPMIALVNQQNLDLFRFADYFETPPGTFSRNRLRTIGNIIFESAIKQNDRLYDCREEKHPEATKRVC
jgi:hypothetical protein